MDGWAGRDSTSGRKDGDSHCSCTFAVAREPTLQPNPTFLCAVRTTFLLLTGELGCEWVVVVVWLSLCLFLCVCEWVASVAPRARRTLEHHHHHARKLAGQGPLLIC